MSFFEVLSLILIALKLIGILEIGWLVALSPMLIQIVLVVIVAILDN